MTTVTRVLLFELAKYGQWLGSSYIYGVLQLFLNITGKLLQMFWFSTNGALTWMGAKPGNILLTHSRTGKGFVHMMQFQFKHGRSSAIK